jgi:hypothetical protein
MDTSSEQARSLLFGKTASVSVRLNLKMTVAFYRMPANEKREQQLSVRRESRIMDGLLLSD